MKVNPLLSAIAAPPIPEAKRWARAYSGGLGPLIDLSQAVPGYPPPDELLHRHAEAAGNRETASYGDILGDRDLRARYAAHLSSLYGATIHDNEIAITAGCNEAFYAVAIALAAAGDSIILPSPWYFNYQMTLDMLGIEPVPLTCRAEAGFVPDVRDAEPLIGERTRAIVLITPNNPTGAIYPPETVRAFAELCARRSIALVLDETYRDFIGTDRPRPHDLFADPSWRETVIGLYSFSKAYCIPGYRAGAVVAAPAFIEEFAKILDCIQISPPRAPQRVLVWAIDALAEWRDSNAGVILDRAGAFRTAMSAVAGWTVGSVGAYFAYVRHPYSGRPAAEVAAWLAAERGVLCLPGTYFGPGQEEYLRIAFANVDRDTLMQLPARLAGAAP